MRQLLSTIFVFLALLSFPQTNLPKVYEQNKTLTYSELIGAYQMLADASPKAQLLSYGKTDVGLPLHLLVICGHKEFDPKVLKTDNMNIVLINNGIYADEPSGIEAGLQIAAMLVSKNETETDILKNTVVCIIPAYNVGGMLNRMANSEPQKNGPEEFGFRNNARNIDLNGDFIMCKSENAQAFTEIFHKWRPDVYIETHSVVGSYNHNSITLSCNTAPCLPRVLVEYLEKIIRPELLKNMEQKGRYSICTSAKGSQPEMETPRSAMGYVSLFNTLAFEATTSFNKPFSERVNASIEFMQCVLEYTGKHAKEITAKRDEADSFVKKQDYFVLNGGSDSVEAPRFYIVPQAWKEGLKRLDWNKVDMLRLSQDVTVEAEMYLIDTFETLKEPFNGHYLHSQVKTIAKTMEVTFYKGYYVIPVKGRERAYIIQTLEPVAPDSYFVWNMFDEILQSSTSLLPKEEQSYKRYPVGRIINKIDLPTVSEKEYN